MHRLSDDVDEYDKQALCEFFSQHAQAITSLQKEKIIKIILLTLNNGHAMFEDSARVEARVLSNNLIDCQLI